MITYTNDIFADIVGQDKPKAKLNFFLRGHQNSGIVPPLCFTAAKGIGKTFIAKAFRKGLTQREGDNAGLPKPLHILNCATIKNAKQFLDYLINNRLQDTEVTLFLDEAHKLPTELSEILLTVLQPNPENKNTLVWKEFVIEFDLRKISWMFATSEPHRLNKPLLDRLERIDLEEYNAGHLIEIIRRNLKDVQFDDGVLEEVVTTLRGNARSAQKMAGHFQTYLGKLTTFFMDDWNEVKKALGIMPLGLSPIEIKVLEILKQHQQTSLTRLAAITGLSPEAVRQDVEVNLLKLDLMQVSTGGRELTQRGHAYLDALAAS